jgi:hypothetical protein
MSEIAASYGNFRHRLFKDSPGIHSIPANADAKLMLSTPWCGGRLTPLSPRFAERAEAMLNIKHGASVDLAKLPAMVVEMRDIAQPIPDSKCSL